MKDVGIKTEGKEPCTCDHKRTGTGVFFDSLGVILCNTCNRLQKIKKSGY